MSENHFGYWVFGRDMYNVDVPSLKSNGVTDIFLNYYAINTHGASKVQKWIEEVNKNNIHVHIWMQCFYDGEWINPVTDSSIIKTKLNEVKKYLNIKGLYGIHLDYLRYPGNAYKTKNSTNTITDFVKQVRNIVSKKVLLSCAVMPEESGDYYYGQDIKSLGTVVDVVIPMQYKGNYNGGDSWLVNTTKSLSSKAKIWSGLQTYNSDEDTTKLSSNELFNDVKLCLNNGANGVILFRYGISNSINFNNFKSENSNNQNTSNNSSIVKKSVIYRIAKEVMDSTSKQKKIPSQSNNLKYPVYSYLLAKTIVTPNKDIKKINVKNPVSPTGTNINVKIYKQEYIDIAKRVAGYIEKNGQLPNYVSYKNYRIRVRVYVDAFARIVNWYYSHNNTLPNYVSVDSNKFK